MDNSSTNDSLWNKVLEAKTMRRKKGKKQRISGGSCGRIRRITRISMMKKRKPFLECTTSPVNGVERRVRTLKKLVPNGRTMEVDELFRETADYILSLQITLKLMQIMAKELSAGSDDQ